MSYLRIFLFTDEIDVDRIKLSDKQAVEFSNEVEQVLRVFIYYSTKRLSKKLDADQTSAETVASVSEYYY